MVAFLAMTTLRAVRVTASRPEGRELTSEWPCRRCSVYLPIFGREAGVPVAGDAAGMPGRRVDVESVTETAVGA